MNYKPYTILLSSRSTGYTILKKKEIQEFLTAFACIVKPVDDGDPISAYKANAPGEWKEWPFAINTDKEKKEEEKSDGSHRIVVIRLNIPSKPLIIIGVYLTCM